MNYIVGTCGNCGGPVLMPYVWTSIGPRPCACASCKAVPAQDYGPVLTMRTTVAKPAEAKEA